MAATLNFSFGGGPALVAIALLMFTGAASAQEPSFTYRDIKGAPFQVFLVPDGNDANDGLTLETAVLTLERTQQIIAAQPPVQDFEVRIAPGRYVGQKVVWTYTLPEHTITFRRLEDDGERPVFDGCLEQDPRDPETACPGGTWFTLRHSGNEETNLHFWYIRVERYQTAISLKGGREMENTSNGSNRIYGCYFDNIGNDFNHMLKPSTAAVRLVNSDDNEIANNHFVRIINHKKGGLLHAIYVAHMSDRNRILRNRFYLGNGDPIQIRDYSNDNVINDNRFIQIGINAAYTEWYCDHDVRDDCTKANPECPSWNNQFRNNLLDGNYNCDPLWTFRYMQDDETMGCRAPLVDHRRGDQVAQRLRTSGNTRTDTPCSSELRRYSGPR